MRSDDGKKPAAHSHLLLVLLHVATTSSQGGSSVALQLPPTFLRRGTKHRERENKMLKPCKHLQSQDRVKKEKRKNGPTVIACLMLVACVILEIIQH